MIKFIPLLLLLGCSTAPQYTIEKGHCVAIVYIKSVKDLSDKQYERLHEELYVGWENCLVTNIDWRAK